MNVQAAGAAFLLVLSASARAEAQTLPSEPIALAGGAVTVSGDVSAAIGGTDPGFYNYTDYEHSTLRMFRVDLTAAARAGDHVSFLGEVRSENIGRPDPYALYVRIRPWTGRRFDIQAGRVPPTFGAFARRTYASDNLLIGYPLATQYLTSLRADAVPATADELLRMRGRGWLSSFSIGEPAADRGLPLATAFRWDTGVQLHAATDVIEAAGSVTTGTISDPLFHDNNSGRQLAGRVAVRPAPGLVIGASGSHGPYLSTSVVRAAVGEGRTGDFDQNAWGVDAEYSRDYYLVRGEAVFSHWTVPPVHAPLINEPLRAAGTWIEGRYKIRPGLYAAARVDHLGFGTITGSAGPQTWDADVTRVEIGGGYSIQRNLLVKASYQYNRRDTVRVPTLHLTAMEIVFWF